jgi:hypothetical protein
MSGMGGEKGGRGRYGFGGSSFITSQPLARSVSSFLQPTRGICVHRRRSFLFVRYVLGFAANKLRTGS